MFGLETILKLLAPHDCLACGREGSLLCEPCAMVVVTRPQKRCFSCKRVSKGSQICSDCREQTGLQQIWVAAAYDGVIEDLIKKLKFERAKDAAQQLAAILAMALPAAPINLTISYIPTATSRVRERGYDHARQVAMCYARSQGRKIYPLLRRHGQARQVGASRRQRLQQLETSFQIKANVAGKNILLIDDVVTTGSSLQAAAEALYKAGAKSVSALVVAQKQETPD